MPERRPRVFEPRVEGGGAHAIAEPRHGVRGDSFPSTRRLVFAVRLAPTCEGFRERQTRPSRGDLLHHAALPPQILDAMEPTRQHATKASADPRAKRDHLAAIFSTTRRSLRRSSTRWNQRAKATIWRSSPPRGAPSAILDAMEPTSRGDLLHHAALPPQILDAMSPTREGFCERQTRPSRGDLLHHAALPPQILDAMSPTREGFRERQTRPPRGDLLHHVALPLGPLDGVCPRPERDGSVSVSKPRGESPRPRLDASSSLCVFERVDPPMERRGGGASGRASERLRHQSSQPRRLLHRFDPPLKRAPDPTETPPT